MWVRGLKQLPTPSPLQIHHVAPYVGAWIETPWHVLRYQYFWVAPYVGAWIETLCAVCLRPAL